MRGILSAFKLLYKDYKIVKKSSSATDRMQWMVPYLNDIIEKTDYFDFPEDGKTGNVTEHIVYDINGHVGNKFYRLESIHKYFGSFLAIAIIARCYNDPKVKANEKKLWLKQIGTSYYLSTLEDSLMTEMKKLARLEILGKDPDFSTAKLNEAVKKLAAKKSKAKIAQIMRELKIPRIKSE